MQYQKARQHDPRARCLPLQPSQPLPRSACRDPLANGWEPRLGNRVESGVPIWHCVAPRPSEQGRCSLHRASGRGAHPAGPWDAACAGAGHLQGGAAKQHQVRSAICGSLSKHSRSPELQPSAGTYTWHRSRQSRWSSVRLARRSALRCSTPSRPFCQTVKSQNFGFMDSTNSGHPLEGPRGTVVNLIVLVVAV
jgi:hypothetical protein